MKNMRIGARILLGFTLVVGLTALMGTYALWKQAAMREFTQQMDNRDFRILESLRKISQDEEIMRAMREQAITQALLRKEKVWNQDPTPTEQQWREARDSNIKLLGELENSLAGYEASALTPARAAAWSRIRIATRDAANALRTLTPEVEAQFGFVNRGDFAAMIAQLPSLDRARTTYDDKLQAAERLTSEQMSVGREEIQAYYDRTRSSILVAIISALLAGIVCSIIIQRSITRPLSAFMGFVGAVGKGDLTRKALVEGRDELSDLAHSLNLMVAGLGEVAAQTRAVAENLNAATAEILASTQQQAASTAEQAAAVHQANATMAEITQSGAQISERAKQVAAAAEATSSSSSAGLKSVQNTAATMEGIREQAEAVAENVIALSEKTQAVGEIIATVNDIAEQSHLLALNAAIEAAAAGEQGRTFAVVASEMKNLADQSKEATVQVRSILGDIQKGITGSVMLTEEAVKRVESGRQQAGVADQSIRKLTDNIQQSVQAFQQIVAGGSQQQIGFEQVTQAFKDIGLASEQAAASTRQSEKAAANLNALAQQLRTAVEKYRI